MDCCAAGLAGLAGLAGRFGLLALLEAGLGLLGFLERVFGFLALLEGDLVQRAPTRSTLRRGRRIIVAIRLTREYFELPD